MPKGEKKTPGKREGKGLRDLGMVKEGKASESEGNDAYQTES